MLEFGENKDPFQIDLSRLCADKSKQKIETSQVYFVSYRKGDLSS